MSPRLWWVGGLVVVALFVAIVAGSGDGSDRTIATVESTSGSPPVASTSSPVATADTPPVTAAGTSTTEPSISTSTSSSTSSLVPPATFAIDLAAFEIDVDDPALGNRDLPDETVEPVDPDEPPPSTLAPPPWAGSVYVTDGGHISTDVGCAADTSLASLDRFFGDRVGPVLGWDYQHVYPLGGGRYLWLFQDTFVDHTGAADSMPGARFVHNAALVQDGACFRLLHRGSTASPQPFEIGDGRSKTRQTWWWPMGGELAGGRLWVFWAEMVKDPYDPDPPNGLGWHPVRTYLASYDTTTLARQSFSLAPDSGVAPIYGYAVSSDETHTYLFGNTFEQNMIREGGFWNPVHSATSMWLARVPRGELAASPEYRTADGWSSSAVDAVPIVDRYYVENPMQPRYLAGQWVSATAVDGYWGSDIAIDVADDPWGPWYTTHDGPLVPRGGDPKMNTYHAHLMPWGGGSSGVAVSVSNNARDMRRDAWYSPHRYRPTFLWLPVAPTPTTTTVPPTTSTTTTSTTSTSTTTSTTTSTSSTTSTTVPATTTTSTSTTSTTSTSTTSTTTSTTSTTSTTVPDTTTSTTTPAADG